MIFDRISESSRYVGLHPLFPRAFAYLAALTSENAPEDKLCLDGEALFVAPFRGQTIPEAEAKLEVHRLYIDIHVPLVGQERVG